MDLRPNPQQIRNNVAATFSVSTAGFLREFLRVVNSFTISISAGP